MKLRLPHKRWIFLTTVLLLVFGGVFYIWWHMPLAKFWQRHMGFEQKHYLALSNLATRSPDTAAAEIVRIFRSGSASEKSAANSILDHRGYWNGDTRRFPNQYLSELIELYQRGQSGALLGICNIDEQKACEFVISEIVAGRAREELLYRIEYKQVMSCFVICYKNATPLTPQLHTIICGQMHVLGEKIVEEEKMASINKSQRNSIQEAAMAARQLLSIIQDVRYNEENRILALEALGMLGASASVVLPALEQLSVGDDAVLRSAIDVAIIRIKTPDSVERYIEDIQYHKKYFRVEPDSRYAQRATLMALQKLGEAGNKAGAYIMDYLNNSEWDYEPSMDIRFVAARTLGIIKYTAAEPELTGAAWALDDWAFSCSAVKSLGQLGSETAKRTLKEIVEKHPFPVVRMSALEALTASTAAEVRYFKELCGSFSDDYSSQRARANAANFTQGQIGALKLRILRSKIDEVHYRSVKTGKIEIHPFSLTPKCGVAFADGYLLGYDEGEFGGGLVYYNGKTSKAIMIEWRTVPVILNTKSGVLAYTYGAMIGGEVFYRAEMAQDGWPVARPVFRMLPDAAVFLEEGNLHVGWGMGLTAKGFERLFQGPRWISGLWGELENYGR